MIQAFTDYIKVCKQNEQTYERIKGKERVTQKIILNKI